MYFLFFIPSWLYPQESPAAWTVLRISHFNFYQQNLMNLDGTQQQTGRIPPVEETEIYMYCIHLLKPGPGCLSLLAKWFTSWGEGVRGNIYKSDWCGPDNWSNFDPRIQSHPFLIPARAAASHRLWHPLFIVQCLKNPCSWLNKQNEAGTLLVTQCTYYLYSQ